MSSAKPTVLIYIYAGNVAKVEVKTVLDVPQSNQVISLANYRMKVNEVQNYQDLQEVFNFIKSRTGGCMIGGKRATLATLQKQIPANAPEDYTVVMVQMNR